MARWALGVIAIAAILAVSGRARADEDADALKARANQAMMNMNYAEALAAYRAALEKNPSDTSLLYNIGRAHQAREEYPEALDALTEFERKAPPEIRAKVPMLAQLMADVRARVGSMNLRCTKKIERGAVFIGDRMRVEGCSPTPKAIFVSLPTKSATIEIKLESADLQASTMKVVLEGGRPPVDVTLTVADKATSGVLHIRVTPPSAVVSVDGTPRGNTPLDVQVGVGSHVVDVVADGHESVHVPLVVDPGSTREVVLSLEKKPPITHKWWFWAGVGSVVVGVAIVSTILIAQPERAPSRGTIDPGVTQAPLVSF
jgi:hypothetical protein